LKSGAVSASRATLAPAFRAGASRNRGKAGCLPSSADGEEGLGALRHRVVLAAVERLGLV
jgi:hypothetical protein